MNPEKASSSWRRPRARLVGAGFALLLTLVLLEGGARLALALLGPDVAPVQVGWKPDQRRSRIRDLVYVPDPDLFFRLRPGIALEKTANPRIFDLRTNSLGLRGAEIARPKPPTVYRVLAVGDSCTFGSGAGDADTYPAQLEQRLAGPRPELAVEVLNAGVPGFTSFQALRYLEIEGFGLEPDAILFATGVNDASPATAGGKRRFGGGRMLSDREFAEAVRTQHGLGITRLLWRAGLWPDSPGTATGREVQTKTRVSPREYEHNLDAFARQSLERGIVPLIIAWPLRRQAYGLNDVAVARYQRIARSVASRHGTPFIDLVDAVHGRPELFIDVVHMNSRGYGVVADHIAATLAAESTARVK